MHVFILQPTVPVSVRMEGSVQLLTPAPVMWGGVECSVKHVRTVQGLAWVSDIVLLHTSPLCATIHRSTELLQLQ